MHGATPPFPNTPSWSGAQLKKHSDYFICATTLWRRMGVEVSSTHP